MSKENFALKLVDEIIFVTLFQILNYALEIERQKGKIVIQ